MASADILFFATRTLSSANPKTDMGFLFLLRLNPYLFAKSFSPLKYDPYSYYTGSETRGSLEVLHY
jgi:hypothetical protein